MYSPFYYYFEIRSDSKYSKSIQTKIVESFLQNCAELQKGKFARYVNSHNFPWITIELTTASQEGNYPIPDSCTKNVINLLVIVGSKKGSDGEREKYDDLLIKIAKYLNWELIEEQNEDSQEDVKIWTPSKDIDNHLA